MAIEKKTTNKYLISALLLGVIFHSVGLCYTLASTYDALIHLFFADHYAQHWFEPWSDKWYTGFSTLGYPPLVHQCMALFSYIGGAKFGLYTIAIIAVILFITGVYRYALLLSSHSTIAGYAALLSVFSSSFLETLHIFGQLPSILGIAILMHALPEIYFWIKTGKARHLVSSWSLIAVTVTSHHVTPIFGMVFFVFPLLGMAIMEVSKTSVGAYHQIRFRDFMKTFFRLFKRILSFGAGALLLIILCILPYWINTKNNPITQVPIPHGSRDNFLEVSSSGLVFFIIPWGVLLCLLPYFFYRFYSRRYLFFGLSFTLLLLLGTGGTTPMPKFILGDNAFNILTLDRFTLWASIMVLPLFGEFAYRFIEGDLKQLIQKKYGNIHHRILGGLWIGLYLFMVVFTMSLGHFKPLQPQKIQMQPLVNFLKQDQHDHWRYLPLGFGDQMAWLSTQTDALTVDGNYHSARRLPELTTRAVERLENSKFRGIEGLGSLQQFLTVPEKYHLKYIFSNDKFYDPILYFCGWQRLRQLENGIMVWEKLNVPPLPNALPKDPIPLFQKLMWGLIPVSTALLAFVLTIPMHWIRLLKTANIAKKTIRINTLPYQKFNPQVLKTSYAWGTAMMMALGYGMYLFYVHNATQINAKNVISAYYDALDFKEFERAYSYIDPNSHKTLNQYLLEISVQDGLLSSYAKLNDIAVVLTGRTDSTASVKAITNWITPLKLVEKTLDHQVVKRKGKWYIKPSAYDLYIPPDQLIAQNTTTFYNHGRRRITSAQTYHEDLLKQPAIEVLSAKIIQNNQGYALIGEVQNIDNVPADVVIKGTLYSDDHLKLATYNVKDQMKHKLMPKELSSFRINFEDIAWISAKASKPKVFDPYQFTAAKMDQKPVKFDLHCAGNVATTDLYKGLAINALCATDNQLHGILFNTGIQEVTIPQLLISYYDKNKKIVWVDHTYLSEAVRPQRKLSFVHQMPKIKNHKTIAEGMDLTYVNGLPNSEISRKMVPHRKTPHRSTSLLTVQGEGFEFIKIEVNCYIGAPN